MGAVLSQLDAEGKERPVAFFSRKLSGKPGMGQRGWSVREQETYAIVLALLKFCSWIASSEIEIICWRDHKSLEAWFKEDVGRVSGPLGRRGRWHAFLSSFDITVSPRYPPFVRVQSGLPECGRGGKRLKRGCVKMSCWRLLTPTNRISCKWMREDMPWGQCYPS